MLLLHGNNRYHAKEREYQGTDIVAENTYRAELGLHMYGRSWQETTTGANLVNSTYYIAPQNNAKIAIVNPDTDFAGREWQVNADVENGNINTGISFRPNFRTENIKFKVGETYTASGYVKGSFNPKNFFRIIVFVTKIDGSLWNATRLLNVEIPSQIKEYTRYSITFTLPEDFDESENNVIIAFSNLGGNYYFTKPMLQKGSILTAYEPYTGGIPSPNPDYPQPINSIGDSGNIDVVVSDNNVNSQTLTINTPNGLCGIPVDTGGNYTDSTGQQWVCDEVDFERGVYVQRIKALKCTTFSKVPYGGETHWYLDVLMYDSAVQNTTTKAYKYVKCDKLPSVSQLQETAYDYPIVAPYGHTNYMELRFRAPKTLYDSIDNFQAAITGCIVIYPLATPIETPLTEEELAAYKAIKSYPHYTHIESAAELGVTLKEY